MQATIQVQTVGAVDPRDIDYSRKKVAGVVADLPQPVLFGKVRLTQFSDPALARPALAQVNIDVNGRVVRARAARKTMTEAIDEARDRLRDRARHVCEVEERRMARRQRLPG